MKKLILLFSMLLLGVSFVFAVDIPGNTTYQFNFTNSTNETEVVNFFALPIIQNVSLNHTNLTINLDSGQVYEFENELVTLKATCQSAESEGSVCTVNQLLEPGELYQRTSPACDLELKCREVIPADNVCLGVVQQNFSTSYSIQGDEKLVTFKFGNEEQVFPLNKSFDWNSEVKYSCQTPVNFTSKDLAPALNDICAQTNPYLLDWYNNQVSAYSNLRENCDSNKDENRETENELRSEILSCNDARVSLLSDQEGLRVEVDTYELQVNDLKGEKTLWSALTIMLAVLTGLAILSAAILGFLYFREKSLNRGGYRGA